MRPGGVEPPELFARIPGDGDQGHLKVARSFPGAKTMPLATALSVYIPQEAAWNKLLALIVTPVAASRTW